MIKLPEKCLRDQSDCTPLSQISSDCLTSFICCGYGDPETRELEQDRFRVCWKNDMFDDRSDYDRRDIIDTISVLAQALSVDEVFDLPEYNPE